MNKLCKLSFLREYTRICNKYGMEIITNNNDEQMLFERDSLIWSFEVNEKDVVLFNDGEV